MSLVINFLDTLYNRLRSKVPIDTGNMLAHIVRAQKSEDTILLSISAPMHARAGRTSRRTKRVVTYGADSDYDYAKHVNYSSKSPHQFWVEHQIVYALKIVKANVKYGLY